MLVTKLSTKDSVERPPPSATVYERQLPVDGAVPGFSSNFTGSLQVNAPSLSEAFSFTQNCDRLPKANDEVDVAERE
jgi:hypothetical protein